MKKYTEETELGSRKEKDWTEPDYLSNEDWKNLKHIKRLYDAGKFKEAMEFASDRDTIVREAIPSKIWKEIGRAHV